MSLSLTYPGIYIQELPGPAPTITPSPTSVTVFIGYTHPYKTVTFGQPVPIGSFADYQRAFGGFYSNAWLPADVAFAVYQFFLNGGSNGYVVGLQASGLFPWVAPVPAINAASPGTPPAASIVGGLREGVPGCPMLPYSTTAPVLTFYGLEPVDPAHSLTVLVNPQATPASDTADFTFTYGSTVETFRQVSLTRTITASTGKSVPNPNFVETRINGVSNLIWVGPPLPPPGGAALPYGTAFTTSASPPQPIPLNPPTTATVGISAAFQAKDFTDPAAGPFATDGLLDKVQVFNLMVIPGVTDNGVWSIAIAFCERKRAFLIMDPPPNFSADGLTPASPLTALPAIEQIVQSGVLPQSTNAALYFPYLNSTSPLDGTKVRIPPSGTVAGIFANTDANRGVWKAPAGLETITTNVSGVVPEGVLTDYRHGILNPLGVNCLRTFPGIGTVVFGARTTTTQNASLQQWRYVPVRRMALFIEQTLYANLSWVIFEPNDTPLWNAIETSINAFMVTLFHQGAFQGATPKEAFQVVCDSTTTTQTDINNGIVRILVAFAPLKPAEFVVVEIQQLAGQAQS